MFSKYCSYSIILLLSFIMVLSSHSTSAQFTIQLVDQFNNEPVAYAHAYFQNSNRGVVSNSEGYIGFKADLYSSSDSLVIQHIAYKVKTITWTEAKELAEIRLEPKSMALSNVVVHAKNPVSILNEALDRYSLKPFNKTVFETYFREYVVRNGEYAKYADGVINFHIDSSKNGKINIDSEIVQSRAFDLVDESKIDLDLISPIDMKTLVSYNELQSIKKFLDPANQSDYEYTWDLDWNLDDEYLMINVIPKNMQKPLYLGSILIRMNDLFIEEVRFKSDPDLVKNFNEKKLLGISIKPTKVEGFLQFSKHENDSYLKYGKISLSLQLKSKNGKLDQNNEFVNELVVYDLNNDESNGKFKSYSKKSLYKNGDQYDYNYWESERALVPTTTDSQLLNTLIQKISQKKGK